MKQNCGNCKFAGGYLKPDPLPEPVQRSLLWGLIKWEDGPSDIDRRVHSIHTNRHENEVPCMRFVETVRKPKTGWCGEYQPKGEPK